MTKKGQIKVTDTDLDYLKNIVRPLLKANISLKEYYARKKASDEEFVKVCEESMNNSCDALNMIDLIENVETLNYVLNKAKKFESVIETLALLSGTLSDKSCLEFDKQVTNAKELVRNKA